MSYEIDVEELISLVQVRPTIWDKAIASYKNRKETKKAWREVCIELNCNFEELDDNEKNEFGKEVMKRWVNIRDSYHKFKKKSDTSVSCVRKYIYFDQLQFLNKVLCEHSAEDSLSTDGAETYLTDNSEVGSNAEGDSGGQFKAPPPPRQQLGSRKRRINAIDKKQSHTLEETEDRHLCFFKGIIPSLSSFTDDEIIKFQMGTLQLITSIKQSRLQAPQVSSFTSRSPLTGSSQKQYELQIEYKRANVSAPKTRHCYEQFLCGDSPSSDDSQSSYIGSDHSDIDLSNT